MATAAQTGVDFREAALACLNGLYGYAMSLTHNQEDAEDLVNDTYVRAVQACDRLAPGSHVKSWLYAILRNIWLNKIRHDNSGPRLVYMDDGEQAGAVSQVRSDDDQHARYVAKVERDSLRAAVRQLPLPFREVLVLREFEGLSYEEIAVIVQCPAGTVMSRLGRAREKLRVLLSAAGVRPAAGVGDYEGW
jgi:RNA polymerase sigma-70 factor (ECF subfamily)